MGLEIISNNQDFKPIYYTSVKHSVEEDLIAPQPGGDRPVLDPQFKTFIDEAVEKLRSAGDLFNKRLDFQVDEETNRIVVKVIDTKTDKVIKEIPPEQLLHLAAKIQEMIGLLVDEER
jgi:flagellar protein FlaG